jgi:hypothetical protein
MRNIPLLSRRAFYREFPLQELAFAALNELLENGNGGKLPPQRTMQFMWDRTPRIFAIETSKTGKRKYVVCHLGRFMHRYWRDCAPYARHFYELIREDVPCRLYFGKSNTGEGKGGTKDEKNACYGLCMDFFIFSNCIFFRLLCLFESMSWYAIDLEYNKEANPQLCQDDDANRKIDATIHSTTDF